jgi:hypothetical protein
MINEDDIPLEIRTFEPLIAFEQTVFDLVEIIDAYKDDSTGAMDAMTFLQATKTASDRLRAISTMTVSGLLGAVSDKIPRDVYSTFQQQVELEELMDTPEDKHRKMVQALKDITKRQR